MIPSPGGAIRRLVHHTVLVVNDAIILRDASSVCSAGATYVHGVAASLPISGLNAFGAPFVYSQVQNQWTIIRNELCEMRLIAWWR